MIAGNGILTGDHDAVGRLATLLAGWPETVPGMTLNRFCGSAQQAITMAAMGVASGYQDLVVAGGVESMSRWDLTAGSVTIDGGNPDFRAAFPTVPAGHLGRPHRHARGLRPHRRRRVRGGEPTSRRRSRSPRAGSTAASSR